MSDLIKVLMLEDDEAVCEAYRREIEKKQEMELVYATGCEGAALNYLRTNPVDVVILDLELKEGDGLSFLIKAKQICEKKPYIMVVTNTGSEIMLGLVRENGADFVYQKTNSMYTEEKILSMIKKALPFQTELAMRKMAAEVATKADLVQARELKRYIYQTLVDMGFKAGTLGTAYLQDILHIALKEHTEVDDTRVKELYEETAQLNNTMSINVERNVRSAIETTWKQTNLEDLQMHYPFEWNRQKGKPTNKEFIINMLHLRS